MHVFLYKFKMALMCKHVVKKPRGDATPPDLFSTIDPNSIEYILQFLALSDLFCLVLTAPEVLSQVKSIYNIKGECGVVARSSVMYYLLHALHENTEESLSTAHEFMPSFILINFFKYLGPSLRVLLSFEDFCFIVPRPILPADTHSQVRLEIDRYCADLLEVLRLLPGVTTLKLIAALPAPTAKPVERHVPAIAGRCELKALTLVDFSLSVDDIYAITLLPCLVELTLIYSQSAPILTDLFSRLHKLPCLRALNLQAGNGFDERQLLSLQGCKSLTSLSLPYPISACTRTFLTSLWHNNQSLKQIIPPTDSQTDSINCCAV